MDGGTSLEGSLIRFLKGTTVSWAIVRALAAAERPLTFEAMIEELRSRLAGRIPDSSFDGAGRVCLSLLTTSGWVAESDEGIQLTDLGRELFARVEG